MIELALKNNKKKLYFNLKSYSREKSFRDAWYSMSDIPSCKDKKLRVTTDRNKNHTYKISEIKNVQYIDREYLYDKDPSNTNGDNEDDAEDPLLEKPTIDSDDKFICSKENPDCIINSDIINRPPNYYPPKFEEYDILPDSTPDLSSLIFDISLPSNIEMPPCLKAIKEGKLEYEELPECAKKNIEKIKNAFSKIYDSLPKELTDKLRIFTRN